MLTSSISVSRMRMARLSYRRACSSPLQTCSTQPLGNFRLQETYSQSWRGIFIPQRSHTCGTTIEPSRLTSVKFWKARTTWKRAAINTLRCLIGCTFGDFTTMWFLQSSYPQLGMGLIMLLSMSAGISSSMALETILLHHGRDRLPWKVAGKTATGMSLISMVAMEVAENAVDYLLTGGAVELGSARFWLAAGASVVAGFLTPLPYNYARLRKYNMSCH